MTGKQRHILLVDDDRLVLASLSRALQQCGYRVTDAANGEDAYALTERVAPDLALLDVRMPGMSGIELGKLLHDQFAVPFLYLSAYGQADIVAMAAENGAMGYLVKPLDSAQILPSIETALSRAAELKRLRETEGQLSTALAGSREISIAIGLLMERHHVDRDEAFEALRGRARSERRTLAQVAAETLEISEKLNSYKGIRRGNDARK